MNVIRISAAGSGKTTRICKDALVAVENSRKKALIVSYTNRGVEAIENAIKSNNGGILSSRIDIKTWYVFVLNDLLRPYQITIDGINTNEIKGLNFEQNPYDKYHAKGTRARYLDKTSNVKSDVASEMAYVIMCRTKGVPLKRLFGIYSHIYIDELQDMSGSDLNVINELLKLGDNIVCCGDHRQATFCTNKSKKNKQFSGKNLLTYCSRAAENMKVSVETELISHRFNRSICSFANTLFPDDSSNDMASDMRELKGHDGVFVISAEDENSYYETFHPQVLRYAKNTLTEYESINFGASKGLTFDRVLIKPNKKLLAFLLNGEKLDSPHKYYVAVTRPRYSLTFVVERLPEKIPGFCNCPIQLKDRIIDGFQYDS